jgi:hypothetical protein
MDLQNVNKTPKEILLDLIFTILHKLDDKLDHAWAHFISEHTTVCTESGFLLV